MKKIYLGFLFSVLSTVAVAQTKVGGTPTINANAMLEIEASNKGLLLPRLELVSTTDFAPLQAHVAGMTVYNTKRQNDVVPGFYYNDGTKWQQMVTSDNKAVKFFYMPSIVFNTGTPGAGNKDLYQEYVNQFTLVGNTASSIGAPAVIPHFPEATDLYYYVTDYDATVFSNIVIQADGKMTYEVLGTGNPYSVMNIVFVVKE
ncbi:hypothetical protein [Myroides sp. WP-1]|uniref:hypothetical protein n=1 Tax=Myroides sp. WP-1 TaxID=2759944 RepID=UPI0015FBD8C3|nr:hypothetical protein [Myroides sp. WP-1]MBB1140229.1 hypothetical protein [Myroides sp. WP-1]